jgi:hypothetical protein
MRTLVKLRLGLFALVWLSTLGTPATAVFQPQDITIPAAPSAATTSNPILLVTQLPVPNDTLTVATTFGNHRGEPRDGAAICGYAMPMARSRT